jgi:hypothetical protein
MKHDGYGVLYVGRTSNVAITTAPEFAHGLLASVHHFCESGGMRLSIRDSVFGIAFDDFGNHAINSAQAQIDDLRLFAGNCS